jgi:hypothetical protein
MTTKIAAVMIGYYSFNPKRDASFPPPTGGQRAKRARGKTKMRSQIAPGY